VPLLDVSETEKCDLIILRDETHDRQGKTTGLEEFFAHGDLVWASGEWSVEESRRFDLLRAGVHAFRT
jgi:hypothetical protein